MRLDQAEREDAGELAHDQRGAAHRRQREAVEEAVSMSLATLVPALLAANSRPG